MFVTETSQKRNIKYSVLDCASVSDFEIIPSLTRSQINIVGYVISASSNTSFVFKSSSVDVLTGLMYSRGSANNVLAVHSEPISPLLRLPIETPLIIRPTSSIRQTGYIQYYYDTSVTYS